MSERAPRFAGAMRVRRTRGATSGLLLVLLGIWGAILPFVGPIFDFAYTPDSSWTWTAARGWYEVAPGAATVLAGLLLMASSSRAVLHFAGWLAAASGAWFIVGPVFSPVTGLGILGQPISTGTWTPILTQIALFYGLGAVILFLAGSALGRVSVRSVGDVRAAERRAARDEERRTGLTAVQHEDDPGYVPGDVREHPGEHRAS